MSLRIGRRCFTQGLAASAALAGSPISHTAFAQTSRRGRTYTGPNVIIVRFGGGVRRRETIDPNYTYAPYLHHELLKRGTLFKDMRIANLEGVVTSHGEGTLYILTGKYEKYKDVSGRFLGAQFEASVPTLFEYLRKAYAIPPHQTLLINGEDRPDEEFYTFGNHRLFGVNYRSEVLSLYRYKTYLLRQKIKQHQGSEKERSELVKALSKLESFDTRRVDQKGQVPAIERFWKNWRQYYGDAGFVNPRGDRLLTELAIRAIKQLHPKLMMINYQDPDYVHWGNASHYTRAISIIDQDLQRLVNTVDHDPRYRGNTIFVIVPDCGRDSNSLLSVPYQHHFNTRSAHEIWALIFGPGIQRGVIVDKPVDQVSIATTIGAFMGFKARYAEGTTLEDAFI